MEMLSMYSFLSPGFFTQLVFKIHPRCCMCVFHFIAREFLCLDILHLFTQLPADERLGCFQALTHEHVCKSLCVDTGFHFSWVDT